MATRRDSLAARREALGLTQEALAHKLGVELSTVGRWERATLTPQPWRRPELARALRVSLDELDDLLRPAPPRTAEPAEGTASLTSRREGMVDTAVVTGGAVAGHVATRRRDTRGEASPARPVPLLMASVSRQVAEVHRLYQAACYAEVRRLLPSVTAMVDELVTESSGARRRDVFGVECSLHIAVAKLATKAGNHAEAWAVAERARVVAEAGEDRFGEAAAAYQRTCALLRAGESDHAEHVASVAAERLRDRDRHSLTWRGALTLINAIIAARRNDSVEAAHRLDQAEELAQLLGMDDNIGWTAFGPTNVVIHRLSVAATLADPCSALREADKIDVARMSTGLRGRQAQFHLDNAWAHTQLSEDPEAVIHLLDTERVAPEFVSANPTAHELIQTLMRRERRHRVPGLRGLAQRVGVAA